MCLPFYLAIIDPIVFLQKTVLELVFGPLLLIGSIAAICVSAFNFIYTKTVRYVSVALWVLLFVLVLAGTLASTFTMTTALGVCVALLYIVLPVPMIWAVIGGAMSIIVQGCSHIQYFDNDHGSAVSHGVTVSIICNLYP